MLNPRSASLLESVSVILAIATGVSACSQPFTLELKSAQNAQLDTQDPNPEPSPPPEPDPLPSVTPSSSPAPKMNTESFLVRQKTISQKKVSPKARVLFVVDNSGSTADYQTALAQGFAKFGSKYLSPELDLAVAVITTDTYLGGSAANNTTYGPTGCYARLFPGFHDGPRPNIADGLGMSAFIPGTCELTPAALDRLKNNKKRSLRPILSTIPPTGGTADQAYINQLIADFSKNALPGTSGSGVEQGFHSLHQFLKNNEERPDCAQKTVTDPTCFFPHYDLSSVTVPPVNVVVVVSDEHDVSISDFGTGTVIDHGEAAVAKMNDADLLSSSLTLAKAVKKRLDAFFLGLQPAGATDPNYSVFAITNVECNNNLVGKCGYNSLFRKRKSTAEPWGIEYATWIDAYAGNTGTNGRPAQPADTVNSQAKFSASYNILNSDYDALFSFIGTKLVDETKYIDFTQFIMSSDLATPVGISATLALGNGTRLTIPAGWINVTLPRTVNISAEVLDWVPPGDTLARIELTYVVN